MEGYIGQIIMFGGNFAPRNWALCDGQLIAISSNAALFSIIGTTYGGDGRTTMGLPDLRSRVPMHAGSGPGLSNKRLGTKGGQESVTLHVNNMPAHNHTATLRAEDAVSDSKNPTNKLLGLSPSDIYASAVATDERSMHPDSIVVANAGLGQPFNNEQPYQVVNFIICLQGVFPSRS